MLTLVGHIIVSFRSNRRLFDEYAENAAGGINIQEYELISAFVTGGSKYCHNFMSSAQLNRSQTETIYNSIIFNNNRTNPKYVFEIE